MYQKRYSKLSVILAETFPENKPLNILLKMKISSGNKQLDVAGEKRAKTCECKRLGLVYVLLLIGRESGASFLSQSLSVVM